MNKRLKKALRASYEAPPPAGRDAFIKALGFPRTRYTHFLLNQLFYIRKRVWLISILIMSIGYGIISQALASADWNTSSWKIGSISAMLPFLAMLTVIEIYRSAAYRMAELEISFRFSLHQIITARLTLLGGGNFTVLVLLLIFLSHKTACNRLQAMAYLSVPYFIVCGICLWLLNRVRGQEGLYGCAATASLVSAANFFISNGAPSLYSLEHFDSWLAILALSGLFMVIQICKLIKQTEGQTWSLFLTE